MRNKKDIKFESDLQEILTPNDPFSPDSSVLTNKSNNVAIEKESRQFQFKHSKLLSYADIFIRIIAAIIAIALLITFGLKIAVH